MCIEKQKTIEITNQLIKGQIRIQEKVRARILKCRMDPVRVRPDPKLWIVNAS